MTTDDVVYLTQSERDHATRALHLRRAFTVDTLAEFLHQNYRAATKSAGITGPLRHDHGWCDCYGHMKKYFLRRAAWMLKTKLIQNGRLGGKNGD